MCGGTCARGRAAAPMRLPCLLRRHCLTTGWCRALGRPLVSGQPPSAGAGEATPVSDPFFDGLFAPRAIRSDTPGGPLLLELEATHDHGLTPAEWRALLRAYDPEGFDDPPSPPAASQSISPYARWLEYQARAEAGHFLYHSGDRELAGDDRIGLRLVHRYVPAASPEGAGGDFPLEDEGRAGPCYGAEPFDEVGERQPEPLPGDLFGLWLDPRAKAGDMLAAFRNERDSGATRLPFVVPAAAERRAA